MFIKGFLTGFFGSLFFVVVGFRFYEKVFEILNKLI